jgi:uncharacterized protein YjiS (DUF1127 family)
MDTWNSVVADGLSGRSGWDFSVWAAVRTVARRVGLSYRVSQERYALSNLSARELADIGLTRKDVRRELDRPCWDLPNR